MPIVPAYISDEAYIGLMRHVLTTEHGAVRCVEGAKLYELPQLLLDDGMQPFHNPVMSPVQNMIQAKYLNYSPVEIRKISQSVLGQLDVVKGGLQTIQTLSCANVVLSGAGIAASVIGDAMILDQISVMQKKLDQVRESNQKMLEQIVSIRNLTVNEKLAEFQKLENKLYNYILRLKKEHITNELLGDVYNELMDTSAFITEMKRNLLVRACYEISPEMLFELASTYMCCACLYELCFKAYYNNGDYALDERTAGDLKKPIEQLLSEDVKDALYQFFYSRAVGLPIERDIQNSITLPMFGIASGKKLLDSAEKVACSQISFYEKRKVLLDEQLLKICEV